MKNKEINITVDVTYDVEEWIRDNINLIIRSYWGDIKECLDVFGYVNKHGIINVVAGNVGELIEIDLLDSELEFCQTFFCSDGQRDEYIKDCKERMDSLLLLKDKINKLIDVLKYDVCCSKKVKLKKCQ